MLSFAPFQLELFETSDEPSPEVPRSRPCDASGNQIEPADEGTANEDTAVLAQRLGRHLRGRLGTLTLTDNRSRIVSGRPAPKSSAIDVRIHRCFAQADDDLLQAVASFLLSRRAGPARRRSLQQIRQYFQYHWQQRPPEDLVPRRTVLRPVGHHFDLEDLRDRLNRQYFNDGLRVDITWGPAASRRRRRRSGFSVRLGSYSERDQLVRIHRCLDRAEVPEFVVESVVFHEMLHAAIPPVIRNGRRHMHTPEFRHRERLYHHYQEASRWIDQHLEKLVRFR